MLACLVTACGSDTDSSPGQTQINTDARETPRYDDGLVRLDRYPGEKGGYWGNPGAVSLVEEGVQVAMDDRGMLANPEDAARVAPFQSWALALYKYRQAIDLRSDPVRRCIAPAGPRHILDSDGFRILHDRNYDRIYIVFAGGNMNWRVIYMDGREPPPTEEVTGTFYGYSSGHWEGDTLVVNSSGFSESFWFSNGGQPHTTALSLTEKFTRVDYGTLHYEVTIDDPGAYTRSWTSSWTLDWLAGSEIEQDFCEDHRDRG